MSFSFFQNQWEIYDLDHYILMSCFFQLNQRKEKKAGSSAVKRRERTSAKGEFAYETMAQKTLRSGGKRAKMNLPGEGASQGNDYFTFARDGIDHFTRTFERF
jgi:hypothetical protein